MMQCNLCIRGITIGRNEVCQKCGGTGFIDESVSKEAPVKETVLDKAVHAVKKAAKKVAKKK